LVGSMATPTRAGLAKIFADGRYNDTEFRRYLRGHPHIDLEIKSRPPGSKGFVLVRKRWVVERTFAWLGNYRRLVRDYEKQVRSSESRVKVAAIHGMLRRLTATNGHSRDPNVSRAEAQRKAA